MAAGKRYLATTTEAELSQQLGAERAKALESGAPTLAERLSAVLQNTANRLEAGLCQTGPQLVLADGAYLHRTMCAPGVLEHMKLSYVAPAPKPLEVVLPERTFPAVAVEVVAIKGGGMVLVRRLAWNYCSGGSGVRR